jgi:hypothetical protein
VTEQIIASLTGRLAQDTAHVNDWQVSLALASSSRSSPEEGEHRFNNAIALEHSGFRRLLIIFYQGEDIWGQALEGLNQLQDVIVETELQAWPPCPRHGHVLVLELVADELYWTCPKDVQLRMKVGELYGDSGPLHAPRGTIGPQF